MTDFITTFTGKQFHFLNPTLGEIDIRDIAHALSLKCRFSGHCKTLYTVGEHSIRVAEILPSYLQLSGLLHDAAEAYIPDIPTPIKEKFGLVEWENIILSKIEEKYSIGKHPLVKQADLILRATEVRDLMPNKIGWDKLLEPLPGVIKPMESKVVEATFVLLFYLYGGELLS